jgi:multicomponent Na+:H+ antiporter subunit D
VALELLTLSAIALVAIEGKAETIAAAIRYALFALFGSLAYLLGAAMLYAVYGTLDMSLLAERVDPDAMTIAAGALMTAGLAAKTALFPFHAWLPPPIPARRRRRARCCRGSCPRRRSTSRCGSGST